MSILNSISRGFGSQIGRHAANKVLNGKSTSNSDVKNYLSFWEGIKTMMWFPLMVLVAGVFVYIIDAIFVHSKEVLTKGHGHLNLTILFAVIFTFCIGYDYYKNPKYK